MNRRSCNNKNAAIPADPSSECSSDDDAPTMQIRNRKYRLLSRLKHTRQWKQQFAEICRQHNLEISDGGGGAGNNNREWVPLRCSQEELCPYSGLFLSRELAIYVRMGVEHNHRINSAVTIKEDGAEQVEELRKKNIGKKLDF